MIKRPPDFIIGNPERPYLLRWYLVPRNRFLNVYLHCILRDDDDRALHDHPWYNLSIVLKGVYREVMPHWADMMTPYDLVWDMPKIIRYRYPRSFIFRRPTDPHRLEVAKGPVWTLFITGPKVREWGFHCERGWIGWQYFTKPGSPGETGNGCG